MTPLVPQTGYAFRASIHRALGQGSFRGNIRLTSTQPGDALSEYSTNAASTAYYHRFKSTEKIVILWGYSTLSMHQDLTLLLIFEIADMRW